MIAAARWPRTALALPRIALTLGRTYGARGAALRAGFELRRRLGAFRAEPKIAAGAVGAVADGHPFGTDLDSLAQSTDPGPARDRFRRVCGGTHQAYRRSWQSLPVDGEAWVRHPETGALWDPEVPWWRVPHIRPERGDIKDLWEPARFGWVYDLVRGHALQRDGTAAEAFSNYLSTWASTSPPFRGPHWSCGQETAIRAVALLYAEANLPLDARANRRVVELLAGSGERIRDGFAYARSQRNNHGISEATGLVAIGSRLKGLVSTADDWLDEGQRHLEAMVLRQFAEDGWYVQHSFTYLRLALDQLVVAERALRTVGLRVGERAVERIRSAFELLLAVIEPASGLVPNHGANDGAFVHPITLADYRDFRPILTAVAATWGFEIPGDIDPDREVLAWLGLPPPPTGPELRDGVRSGRSGWAAVRTGGVHAFLRAGSYDSRPGHLDPLHLDVRAGGRELIVDPGTFAYVARDWRNELAGADRHNGPLRPGRPPGLRGPRFLWLLWPSARLIEAVWDGREARLHARGAHGVEREVRVSPEKVTVNDRATEAGGGPLRVGWLLHPDADPARLRWDATTEKDVRVGRSEGWFSAYYGERLPAPSVKLEARAPTPQLTTRVCTTPPDDGRAPHHASRPDR